MAKNKSPGDKSRSGTVRERSGRSVRRASKSGTYVLGRDAFGKISEVEGIVVKPDLKADLRRLGNASPERRRAVLSQKYGKR